MNSVQLKEISHRINKLGDIILENHFVYIENIFMYCFGSKSFLYISFLCEAL